MVGPSRKLQITCACHMQDFFEDMIYSHPQKLAALRSELRQRMMASPLGDSPAFVARLERVYHRLWRGYCARVWAERDALERHGRGDSGGGGNGESGCGRDSREQGDGSTHGGRHPMQADGMLDTMHDGMSDAAAHADS